MKKTKRLILDKNRECYKCKAAMYLIDNETGDQRYICLNCGAIQTITTFGKNGGHMIRIKELV